jgi:hypothetical protein
LWNKKLLAKFAKGRRNAFVAIKSVTVHSLEAQRPEKLIEVN